MEQPTLGHEHQADGAVATYIVFHTGGQTVCDDVHIYRIQDNDAVPVHAQGRGRIDPVAVPTRIPQLLEHPVGVITALAGDNGIQVLERLNVRCILQRYRTLAHIRPLLSHLGGGEEYRLLDQIKVPLRLHTLHEDRTHHPAPTNKTYALHNIRPYS